MRKQRFREVHQLVKAAQIQGEEQVFLDFRTHASSCKPRDSEDYCPHPTSKPGHLWRGQMQTRFLQSVQQLLNRTVDRGTVLCPGEQRGTWPQLALGTGCGQNHGSGRNPEEGGRASREGAGQLEAILPPKTWMRGSAPFYVSQMQGTKIHVQVCDVLHTISGASETPLEQCVEP